MKAPLSWLKDYVDINVSEEELAAKLVGAGFDTDPKVAFKNPFYVAE